MYFKKYLLPLIILLLFSGCAQLQSGWEQPVVSIRTFEAVPTEGVVPQFKIGLHIVNPNRTPLILKGMSYNISLEGHKLLTGVANKLPEIPAYGEGTVELTAIVDVFSGIRFFTDLVRNQQRDKIAYSFNAKLDAGALHPLIRVSEKGSFSFQNSGFD